MMPDLEGHFGGLAPESRGLVRELEDEAGREGVPIVGPVLGRLLTVLARAMGARAVLELGAATGYSALHLAGGMPPDGRLVSLERDPAMAARARDNMARGGWPGRYQVLVGEAGELMAGLDGPFDLAFLDIDKTGYAPALPHLERLLRPGGLLVADNTGFAGARDFTQDLKAGPAWLEAQVLCFLPGHSPEHDGLSLAVRAGYK